VEVAKVLSDHGHDAYWAISQYSGDSRKTAEASSIAALWIDIDCGNSKPYPTWRDGLLALLKWLQREQFTPPTHIVKSGYGLHVYWVLDRGYTLDEWLPVAQGLKRALAVGGVKADPARTADAASILRVPGTVNWKDPKNPRPVEILAAVDKKHTLDSIRQKLPAVGPQGVIDKQPDNKWAVPNNYPPGDAEAIAEKCRQMGYFRDRRGAVSEPYWRAGLSILSRCENARIFVHEWSKGDPRYDPKETQAKADGTKGPATCAHFDDVNPGGCTGCPHKVTSPIMLQSAITAAPVEPNISWKHNTVNRYAVTEHGIWFRDPEGESRQVTDIPLWVVEVREKARLEHDQDQSSLLIEWHALDGRVKRGVLYQAHAYDIRAFKTWLADHNIISAVREVKFLVGYISQYTLKLIREQGTREYHEHLGWYEDGFVVGDTIVTKEGSKKALVQSTNPISRLSPKGDVDQWTRAAKILGRREYARHAMVLLSGFASPIYELVGVNSAVMSLVGVSGAGKTLSAQMALSIYGNPDLLHQGSTATANSIEAQLSANRHVPYLLDEVTNYPPHKLAEFIYLAANGQGKSALQRNRDFRPAGTWKLTPYITSNHPVLEFDQSNIQEAHRRRVIELHFGRAFPKGDADIIYRAMKNHAGSAGVVYLQELCRVRSAIPQMFEQALQGIRNMSPLPEANRFGMWTLAASVVGGTIAKRLGLIDFDIMGVIRTALLGMEINVEDTRSPEDIAKSVTQEFITRNSKRVCRWDGKKDLGENVEDPVARIFSVGLIAIHQTELYAEWQKHRVSRSMVKDWLDKATTETKKTRLAPGTVPVRAVIFKTEYLDFKLED
jgi:hypothetical protein